MHQARRRWIAQLVARGTEVCTRCAEIIVPGTPWDLDHRDDGRGYLGPAHATCNRSAGGKRGGARRQSRAW